MSDEELYTDGAQWCGKSFVDPAQKLQWDGFSTPLVLHSTSDTVMQQLDRGVRIIPRSVDPDYYEPARYINVDPVVLRPTPLVHPVYCQPTSYIPLLSRSRISSNQNQEDIPFLSSTQMRSGENQEDIPFLSSTKMCSDQVQDFAILSNTRMRSDQNQEDIPLLYRSSNQLQEDIPLLYRSSNQLQEDTPLLSRTRIRSDHSSTTFIHKSRFQEDFPLTSSRMPFNQLQEIPFLSNTQKRSELFLEHTPLKPSARICLDHPSTTFVHKSRLQEDIPSLSRMCSNQIQEDIPVLSRMTSKKILEDIPLLSSTRMHSDQFQEDIPSLSVAQSRFPEDLDLARGLSEMDWLGSLPEAQSAMRYVPDRLRNHRSSPSNHPEPMQLSEEEFVVTREASKRQQTEWISPPPTARSHPSPTTNTAGLVQSLQHIVTMTDKQVRKFLLPRRLRDTTQQLITEGMSFVQARRHVIAENFQLLNQAGSSCYKYTPSQKQTNSKARKQKQSVSKKNLKKCTVNAGCKVEQVRGIGESCVSVRPVKLSIVHQNFPGSPLAPKQSRLVKNLLEQAYISTSTHPFQLGFKPRFELKPGFVAVTCSDQETADWLSMIVPTLNCGLHLKTLPEGDEPLFHTCQVFIPDLDKRLSIKQILEMLRVGNKKLNTLAWSLKDSATQEDGVLYKFLIDQQSMNGLKDLNFKVHLPSRPDIRFVRLN